MQNTIAFLSAEPSKNVTRVGVLKVIKTRVDGRYRSVDATLHKGRIFYQSHTRKFRVKKTFLPLYKWLSYQANAYIFLLFYPSPYHRISFKVEIKLFDPHVA